MPLAWVTGRKTIICDKSEPQGCFCTSMGPELTGISGPVHYPSGAGHKMLSNIQTNSYLDSIIKLENIDYKKQKSIIYEKGQEYLQKTSKLNVVSYLSATVIARRQREILKLLIY